MYIPFEKLCGVTEFGCRRLVTVLAVHFEKIRRFQLGVRPNGCLQALPDRPAVNFDFAKVVPAANVLEQARHFWKRAPFAVIGQMILSFPRPFLFTL